MEEYYKTKYKETNELLSQKDEELRFYSGIVYFISGMTSTLVVIIAWIVITLVVFFLIRYWSRLSVSDVVALIIFCSGAIVGVSRYKKYIFNWPEEMLIRDRKRKKEIEDLRRK